jgi:lysophospholipase L1-like esterase
MRRSNRGAAVAASILVICLAALVAGSEQPRSDPPSTNRWARHYSDRVALFEKQNRDARNIVMVGSSHIEGFDAATLLPGRRIVNRGIASDRIGIEERGILHRLDCSVFDCNPCCVILENGVNDLGELWRHGKPSIDEIEACFRKVVEGIRTRLPDVPLIIVSLFPTRDKYADLNPSILDFNKRLEELAAEFGCPYLDSHTPFADTQGRLRKEFTRDGLHLNGAGYRLWARQLEAVLPPGCGRVGTPAENANR